MNLSNVLGVAFSLFQVEIAFHNLYFNSQGFYRTVNCLFSLNKFVFISSLRTFFRDIIDIILGSSIQCNYLILVCIAK